LNIPFVPIETGIPLPQFSRSKPRIGIAWESRNNFGSVDKEKSIPLEDFLDILGKDIETEVISFQRKLSKTENAILHARFPRHCTIIPADVLDAENQADVVKEIRNLNCMVTISTTTTHIAACLGIPVILIAAKRHGNQWFWRAQHEYGKCFYPSVGVILGASGTSWWKGYLESARSQFLSRLSMCS
jgi:ADP-heptose:LPS heptosyltransferase